MKILLTILFFATTAQAGVPFWQAPQASTSTAYGTGYLSGVLKVYPSTTTAAAAPSIWLDGVNRQLTVRNGAAVSSMTSTGFYGSGAGLTALPGNKLDGTNVTASSFTATGGIGTKLFLQINHVGSNSIAEGGFLQWIYSNNGMLFQNNATDGLDLWSLDAGTGWHNRVTFANSGNVGIGAASPVGRLQIQGTTTNNTYFGPEFGNTINFNATVDGNSSGFINYGGYNGGFTQFRDLYIDDGKAGTVMFVDGSAASVGIGTETPGAKLEVNGFTKLGSAAPAIKILELSTTTAPSEGGYTSIAHGLSRYKILSVSVMTDIGSYYILPGDSYIAAGYEYGVYISESAIVIQLHATNSENILSKGVYISVVYKE